MAIASLSATASDTYVGGTFYMQWMLSGDALHKCGYICASHATEDLEFSVCPTGGTPASVLALQADLDIDTLVTDGVMYEYYSLHVGTALRLGCEETATALFIGTAVIASADGVAGLFEAATTAGAVAGYSLEVVDVAADKWVEIMT